jgi:hypothetical protein
MTKVLYSKTLWLNVLASIGVFLSAQFGYTLTGAETSVIMLGINGVLRAVTNEPLEW